MKRLVVDASTLVSGVASRPGGGPPWLIRWPFEIVANVEEAATEYDDPTEVVALLRDPDDDYLVALAHDGEADAIVTGDRDLLDHLGLEPQALDARAACRLLGLTG